jgi:hypothetical protein
LKKIKFRFNKSGFAIQELALVTIVLVIMFTAGTTIAQTVNRFITSDDIRDVNSIRNFEILVEEIKNILEDSEAYAFKDNILFSLDKDFIILGFNKYHDKIELYTTTHMLQELTLNKPSSCFNSCLVLYRKNNNKKNFDEMYSQIRIEYFDEDVIFYSFYLGGVRQLQGDMYYRPNLHFYGKPFSIFNIDSYLSSQLNVNNLGNHILDSDIGKEITSRGHYPTAFTYSYFGVIGEIAKERTDSSLLNLYIDKLDFNKIIHPESMRYILITPNTVDIGYSKLPHLNINGINPIVDFRRNTYLSLRSKNPREYSANIISASRLSNHEESLYYFLDYLNWVYNPLVNNQSEDNIIRLVTNLGEPALNEIRLLLEDRRRYCLNKFQEPNQDKLINDCFDFNCSSGNIKDQERCNKLQEFIILSNKYKPSEQLFYDVIKWHAASQHRNYELMLLLSKLDLYTSNLTKQYTLFLDYISENSLTSYDENFPEQLNHFKQALYLKELLTYFEYYDLNRYIYEVFIELYDEEKSFYLLVLNETSYLYIPEIYVNVLPINEGIELFTSSDFIEQLSFYSISDSDKFLMEQIKLVDFSSFINLQDIVEEEQESVLHIEIVGNNYQQNEDVNSDDYIVSE